MNSRYQEKLQKQFLKSTLAPAVICVGMFAVGLFLYTMGYTYYTLDKWSRQGAARAHEIYSYYYRYLTDSDAQDAMRSVISGEITDKRMTYFYRTACRGEPAGSELLLLDRNGELAYYSGERADYNTHLAYYGQVIGQNRPLETVCVSKVYYLIGDGAKWLLNVLLYGEDGAPAGQAFLLMEESTLVQAFQKSGCEVILTNSGGLAAMSTNQALLSRRHYFLYDGSGYFAGDEARYLVRRVPLEDLDGALYTLVETQSWWGYYMAGCLVLLIVAGLLLVQSRKFSKQLADGSARSLEKLHSEFAMVQENPGYQISIDTDDEFGEIAQRINRLLADVKELSEKGLALERSRNAMMKTQIEARLHPHFIYNTLESIRFSILMNDNAEASRMLLALTELLRYSMDNRASYITLEEDMEHIEEYLDIMRFRYGAAFTYQVEIAAETRDCLVPPLFIQPLIENSLKYGMEAGSSMEITVRTWMDGGDFYIRVSDNGAGMTAQQLERQRRRLAEGGVGQGHCGIGLVAESLKLQYGPGSAISLESAPGKGLTVVLNLKRGVLHDGL